MKSYLHVVAVTSLLLMILPVAQADPDAVCEPTDVGCHTNNCLEGQDSICGTVWEVCWDSSTTTFDACVGAQCGSLWDGSPSGSTGECAEEVLEDSCGPNPEDCGAYFWCGSGYDNQECFVDETVGCITDPNPGSACEDVQQCAQGEAGGPCDPAYQCVGELAGTGGPGPCGTAKKTASDCANNAAGTPCAPIHVCVDELTGSGVSSACGQTRQTAQDCQNNAGTTPCAPVHVCADELTGSGESSACGQARKISDDCQAGVPNLPCNPDPDWELVVPEGCEINCQSAGFTTVQIDPLNLPEAYLVECLIVVPLPGEDQPVTYPMPALSPTAECPMPSVETGDVLPLFEEDLPQFGFDPTATIQHGTCEVYAVAYLYGSPVGMTEPQEVPCAFPAA